MNTKRLADALLRVGVMVASLQLSGCGPTSGGTGSPEMQLSDFGAKAASTCSATFATSLNCATVTMQPTDPALLAGTAPVLFVGTMASGPYVLSMRDNQAMLQSRCQLLLQFGGTWGVLPTGESRFFGNWTNAAGVTQRAMLWVQQQPGSVDGVQVLVQDLEGGSLLGPLPLREVAAPPTEPPVCP